MKNYIKRMITAFMLIAILPLQVWAAEDEGIYLKAGVSGASEDGKPLFQVHVSAVVPEAYGEKLSSLQLSLMFTDREGNPADAETLEQVDSVSFVWDGGVEQKAGVTQCRYQAEAGVLRIYIAGTYREHTEPLFGQNGELSLGDLAVVFKDQEVPGIYVGVVPGSFKKVQGAKSMPVWTPEQESLPQPVLLTEQHAPGSTGGSGNAGGAGTAQLGADKSELGQMLETAAGYLEADHTPDSYALLKEAVKNAQAVLEDEDASQEDVDKAAEALMNAIGALVPVRKTSIDEGYSQGTSSTGSGSNPGQGGVQDPGAARSAATGDASPLFAWAAAAASGAAIAAGLLWKRKKNQPLPRHK